MNPDDTMWCQPEILAARHRHDAGTIVRVARQAEGLTLAQLGARCRYSASQISRYERGIQPLTDIAVLRRFADALAIPPQVFGLIPLTVTRQERHNLAAGGKARRNDSTPFRVGPSPRCEDGEDPVRRRELLAGIAGVAGAAALGRPAAYATAPDPTTGFDTLLYGNNTAEPVPLATLRSATVRARNAFQSARYHSLSVELPALIATADATCDHTDGDDRAHVNALLADAYIVASNLMVKLNDDTLAWATADRAYQAAVRSEDPLTLADARRGVAIVLRRTRRAAKAHDLLINAAQDIHPDAKASPAQLSMYGTLLQVAAYTAAVDGNHDNARELIAEAADTAARLGRDANHRHTAFGPTNVALYQVSIAQVLGDNGTAIHHAATIHPADIPTAERQGRYWIDVARAYHQWGKHEHCYRALLAAERAAPAEVRYRPPVHRMTLDLLRGDIRQALPGLRAFATRAGIEISA